MQTQTKQRVLGIIVLVAVVSICFFLLFNYTFLSAPVQLVSDKHSALSVSKSYVYELPLAGQSSASKNLHSVSSAGSDADNKLTNGLDDDTTASLRSRAVNTVAITSRLLKTANPEVVTSVKKQCVGQCADQIVDHVAKKRSHTVKTKAIVKSDKARYSRASKVLLQSEAASASAIWVVQIASFRDRNYADLLLIKLNTKRLPTFIEKVESGQQVTIYRVFVGPYIKRKKAKYIQQWLEKKIHLQGVVRKYTL